jgi:chromosome partitioning protein
MVISLLNQKGGTGKSSLSINLAHAFSCFQEKKVLLIDADPQGSCLLWRGARKNETFDIIPYPKKDLHKRIKAKSKGYQWVIVDGPPGQGDITLSIMLASNLVIIPVTPSPLDLWAVDEFKDIIKEARKHNKKLRSKILVSKGIPGTILAREAREAFERYRMQMFQTEIHQRVAFINSFIDGQSVLEYQPNGEAAKEIINLYNELRGN